MDILKKIGGGLIALVLIAVLAPTVASGLTVEELQAQIAALQAQLAELLAQLAQLEGQAPAAGLPAACQGITFERNLTVGMTGNDVKCLQALLNTDPDTKVAETGAGSPGNETSYFGPLTKAAVIKFQEKYKDEVLTPIGLTSGTGFVGPQTRAKLNALLAAGVPEVPTEEKEEVPAVAPGLTVALAPDTPAAGTVVVDNFPSDGAQALVDFLKLKFSTPAGTTAKVTTLKLTRGGISADSDLSNVYLYDGNTRIAEMASFVNKVVTFTNSAGLFTVSGEKTITVKADIANGVSAGKTINFSLASANDIVSDAEAINGTFPITGNTMSTARVDDLGKLTVTSTYPTADLNVDPGTNNYEAWRFTLAAEAQKIEVSYLKLTAVGSITANDLANIRLFDGATEIASQASLAADKTVTFDLSASPLVLASGITKTMTVKVDVVSGTNRNFYFSIQNMADVTAKDLGYGIYIKPNQADAWSIVGPPSGVEITILTGKMTSARATDSPTGNVAKDGTNVDLAKFTLSAYGERIRVSQIVVSVVGTIANNGLDNGRIIVNGTQIGSPADLVSASSDDGDWSAGGDDTVFSLGSQVIVNPGETANIVIRADIKKSDGSPYTGGENFLVKIGGIVATGLDSLTSVSVADASGYTRTIATGKLTAVKNIAMADASASSPSGVPGSTNVKVASFTVTAGSGEGVNVTSFTITDNNAAFNNLQNVKLMYGTTQIGATQSTVAQGGTYTFTPAAPITLAAGQSMVVDVYADIITGATTGNGGYIVLNRVSGTGVVTATSADYTTPVNGQTIYIVSGGTYSLAIDTGTPLAAQYIMGATGQLLAKFKITAGAGENILINKLIVVDDTTSGDEASLINLKLFDGANQVGQTVPSLSALAHTGTVQGGAATTITLENSASQIDDYYNGMYVWIKSGTGAGQIRLITDYDGSNRVATVDSAWETNPNNTSVYVIGSVAVFDLTASPITVSANLSKVIDVKADINVGDVYSNSAHTLKIMANGGITGAGAVTGPLSLLSPASVNANDATVYLTKISIAYASDSPSGVSSGGVGQVVAKFVVSNTTNALGYDAVLKQLKPALSSTIDLASAAVGNPCPNRDIVIYKNSIAAANVLATLRFNDTSDGCNPDISSGTKTVVSGDNLTYTTSDFAAADTAFADVNIASGGSLTLIVTADTQDATSGKTLSVSVGADQGTVGFANEGDSTIWSDGITPVIDVVDGLPLLPVKTLTY